MEDKLFLLSDEHSTFNEVSRFMLVRILLRVLTDALAVVWEPAIILASLGGMTLETVMSFLLVRKSNNRFLWGVTLTGILMNWAALLANGFQMPVFGAKRNVRISGIHKRGSASDRLKFLCDIYRGPGDSVFSLGDVFISVGEVVIIAKAIYEELMRIFRRRSL